MTTPAAPAVVLPGTIPVPSRSQVMVDGIPLASQAAAAASPSQQPAASQRFWSSEPRAYGSLTDDVLVVKLGSPRLINYVSLSLAHFPSQYSIAWQGTDGSWSWLQGPNGLLLTFIISGSVPAVVDSAAALASGVNPFHYGAGHWLAYDETLSPVTVTALAVVGTRALQDVIPGNPGNLPVNASGAAVAYPLGVMGLDFGYRVLAVTDVPYTTRSQSVVTERQAFTVADDINGNPVQLTMRENRASDLLSGEPWKCAPQPGSSAVVNLYADSRDGSGAAQVIDRFYIQPTTSGVSLNLYYTGSAPPAGSGFQAVDTPLAFPFVVPAGASVPAVSNGGLLFADTAGWCDVLNQGTGIDFTQPWWMGTEIQPQFGASDPGSYFMWDCGMVQLWYAENTWAMSVSGEGTFITWPASHDAGDRLQFACGWDGSRITGWFSQGGTIAYVAAPSSSSQPPPLTPAGISAPLNANPYFQQGVAGWGAVNGSFTVTTAIPQPAPVAQAASLVPGGTSDTSYLEESAFFTAVPGASYGWAGWVCPQVLGAAELGFDWYEGGTYVSTTVSIIDLPAGTWSYVTLVFTAPSSGISQGLIRAGRDGGTSAVPSSQVLLIGSASAYANPPAAFSQQPVSYSVPAGCVRFGAPQQADMIPVLWPGNYRLTSWILKQEPPSDASGGLPAQYAAFAAGPPQEYTAPPAGPGPTTQDAVGRFDQSFVNSALSPQGFVGGLGSVWSLASWTPLTADYKLAAGYLQFRPVQAAAFRFEFTGLLAETYTYYKGTPQTAQYFPPSSAVPPVLTLPPATVSAKTASVSSANSAPQQVLPSATADPGLSVGQSVSAPAYSDTAPAATPPAPGAALPTEAIYATDPQGAEAMTRSGGSILNFQPWQAPVQGSPSQVVSGAAAYQEISVTQASATAYFAGVSQLTMYRADYTAASDTAEYIDTFGDTAGIDPASLQQPAGGGTTVPWDWSPGLLTVPSSLPPGGSAQVQSPVYSSAHQVTGIQFASVESGPAQIMPDPSFTEPGVPYLSAVGDALPLTESASSSSPLGSLVTVQRSPGQQEWETVMTSWPLWSDFSSPQVIWLQVTGTSESNPYGGAAYTGAPVQVSAAGRLTIAARVFAASALQGPLLLQLLDGRTGVVIAQEPAVVSGGTVTEWYAQATVGEGTPGTFTWQAAMTAFPFWASLAGETWEAIDNTVYALGSTIAWQIIEQGAYDDSWGIDNVSVFEDSILWEFSGDGGASWWPALGVNANPAGAIVLPPPEQGNGTQLMWRLTGYRAGLTVASLAIRPWYSIYPRGIPPRVQGVPHGPNVAAQDYYGPIASDPYWQAWSGPVPQAWYWAYQKMLQAGTTYQPPPAPAQPASDVLPGNALIISDELAAPETYSDLYGQDYGYAYGVADVSQQYTDEFGNDLYYDDYNLNP